MPNSDSKNQRVWPILLIGLGIIVVGGVVGFLSQGLAVANTYGVDFPPTKELIEQWNSEYFATALGFSRTMIPIHLVIALLAFIAVIIFREPIIQRFGFYRSSLPNWSYLVLMLATPLAWVIGSLLVVYIVGEPSDQWLKISDAFNRTSGIDAIVVIGWGTLGASFAEEVFFRGYLLKGLVRRWNPWLTILITSILFAAIHGGVDFILYTFPVGAWAGILVWRTNSIWPAIVCHGFYNLLITYMCRYYGTDSAGIWANPSFAAIIVLIISVIAMAFAVPMLVGRKN